MRAWILVFVSLWVSQYLLYPIAVSQAADSSSTIAKDGVHRLNRGEALRRVLKVNPQISAERSEELRAKARIAQINAAKWPQLSMIIGVATSLSATNTDLDENGVRSERQAIGDFNFDQVRPALLGQLQVIQPIFTFGKIGKFEKAAHASLEAAEAQTLLKAADVAVEFANIYESHLYAKDIRLFADDILGIVQRSIVDTEIRLEAEAYDVSRNDLLRLKAGYGAAKLIQHQADAVLSQTREGLRAYLQLPANIDVETSEKHLDPVSDSPSSLESLVATAQDKRPEFRALDQAIVAYKSLAEAEFANYYPNIFVAAYASGAYTPDRDFVQSRYIIDPLGHFVVGGMVGLQWQLQWDMPTQRAEEMRADVHRYAKLKLWAETGVPAEVNRYFEEVQRARRDLRQLKESLPVTREWVVRTSADFASGLSDSRAVVEAVQAFVLMQNSQMDAVYRLNTNLAHLAQSMGTITEGYSKIYPGESTL